MTLTKKQKLLGILTLLAATAFPGASGNFAPPLKSIAQRDLAERHDNLRKAAETTSTTPERFGSADRRNQQESLAHFLRGTGHRSLVDPTVHHYTATKITPNDHAPYDRFGYSSAVDGDTMVIGAFGDDDSGDMSGSAYVFLQNPETGSWMQQAKLAHSGVQYDQFGRAVDIDGDTVVVTAPGDEAVHVFFRQAGVWSQQAVLAPDDHSVSFALSVAISGNTIIIGDPHQGASYQGSAYVFERNSGIWSQKTKLVANDLSDYAKFGTDVGISGETVIIGAYQDSVNGLSMTGSAYVFVRHSDGSWIEEYKLIASDGEAYDYFGNKVDVDGDTAVIGAYYDDDSESNAGAAYVFSREGDAWTEIKKFIAPDGARNDRFGSAVAIESSTILIGAMYDDDGGTNSGSAYVYSLDNEWLFTGKLLYANRNDHFGVDVSLSADTLVVGAHRADGQGAAEGGAVYVFEKSTFSQVRVYADNTGYPDRFGTSVDLYGSNLVVGAPYDNDNLGCAYVFTLSEEGVWVETATLTANDGVSGDRFGHSVALFEDTIVVGATSDDNEKGNNAGAGYVFVQTSPGTWMQKAKLLASNGGENHYFGTSVDIDLDTFVIGAKRGTGQNEAKTGSAYVFVRSSGVWNEQAPLSASDGVEYDNFGYSVAVSGNTALVGAYNDDNGQGSAYVFTRDGSNWQQQTRLRASDRRNYDYFGTAVDIDGDTAAIGAHRDDDQGDDTGSVYVYKRNGASWNFDTKLLPDDSSVQNYFGSSVTVFHEDTIIVGAPGDDIVGQSDAGAAYVFVYDPELSSWSQPAAALRAANLADMDLRADKFGYSVAAFDDHVAVGAYWANELGGSMRGYAGIVYVFTPSNAAPSLFPINCPDLPVDTTSPVRMTPTWTDPDLPDDDHAVEIDWGDGDSDVKDPAFSGDFFEHTYSVPGTYSVAGTVTDSFEGVDTWQCEVAVYASPTIGDVGCPPAAVELSDDQPVPLTVTWNDLDVGDTHTVEVDWGDSASVTEDPATSGVAFEHTYSNPGMYSAVVEVTDSFGGEDTRDCEIVVFDSPTINDVGCPSAPAELTDDQPVSLTVTWNDLDVSDTHTVEVDWGDSASDTEDPAASGVAFEHTYSNPGTYSAVVAVTDSFGGEDTRDCEIVVFDSPTIDDVGCPSDPVELTDDQPVSLTVVWTDLDDGDTHTVEVDWGDSTLDTENPATSGETFEHTYSNPGTYSAVVTVTDSFGGEDTWECDITVYASPIINSVDCPLDPVDMAHQPVSVVPYFLDRDAGDTHTAETSWGDGETTTGPVFSGVTSFTHSFLHPGVYTIVVKVIDSYGGWDISEPFYIIIYDPDGGFVTGGGWFMSAAGAYKTDPNLSGKASFGFVSKYKKGAQVPTGNTEFQFKEGKFNFHSTEYDWLVVNEGGTQAQFKGSGKVNGELKNGKPYRFMIRAKDDESGDSFGLRVWYESGATETEVYNNGEQLIDGGSIKVHTKKKKV